MAISLEAAETQRATLIDKYLARGQGRYDGFESAADAVNHLAFMSDKLEETIEYYTQVIGLKLFRIRAGTTDPRVTQVFFDMGHRDYVVDSCG
jgi:hypothetical protein